MTPKRFLVFLIVLAVVVAGGAFYYQMSRDTFVPDQGAELSESEVASLIDAVSKHLVLPKDEEPIIATVADIDKLLETQPFYKGAENGDVLFMYPTSSKAILYSPSRDILINVGPIIVDEAAQQQAPAPTPVEETPEETTEEVQ